ncbi:DAB2IP [Mytilus coruscus]|uniref:DAB2IP n=1 Tax=Mytilus coruscus TaxID=42192 RepID=A0A6J8CDQ1_MYTCO|nr:DAB2IP [Mytilus coruscus]
MVSATLATVLPLWWVYAKPTQPGFWPYRDNIHGPLSWVATAPPVAVSLTPAVAPSNPVPDSRAQSSSSSHGNQGSESAPSLDGFQKLLLDFGESFKAEFSTLSSRMSLLENRVSSHQPSPAKSVENDEREDDELSVSLGIQKRAFLTDEDVDSSSSLKVSKTGPELTSKSAHQPSTK